MVLSSRPSILMQDLYVMRRAIGVYERLVRRFTAQTTDYQVGLACGSAGQSGKPWVAAGVARSLAVGYGIGQDLDMLRI